MSMAYCNLHDLHYDTDYQVECPKSTDEDVEWCDDCGQCIQDGYGHERFCKHQSKEAGR